MTDIRITKSAALAVALAAACASRGPEASEASAQADSDKVNTLTFANPSGAQATYSDNPKVMLKPNKVSGYPFFTSFGTNGRACIHCHTPADGWGMRAASVQYRFSHPLDVTNSNCLIDVYQCPQAADPTQWGTDPLFRPVDGAVSPNADVSSATARQAAYAMLLSKGLIRVGIGVPANADFDLVAADDPYGFASAAQLSLFRRPLPATNLRLSPADKHSTVATPVLTTVMWDGRETLPNHDIIADLMDQANGATLGHAQATHGLSDADRQAIVDFETGMHSAQITDALAGDLSSGGGNGGPSWLSANQPFYVGINDVLTGDPQTKAPFSPNVFTIYTAFAGATNAAQAQIARGEAIFDGKPIAIIGVAGLNDLVGATTIQGTCTSCHDAPNYGHHSVKLAVNIGIADGSRRTSDLPLYTLRSHDTGATVTTTDPGRALVTGHFADIGKFKGPILRGLAARAPYFHNGSAASVADVVTFYDTRFGIGFTDQEKADLAAFLLAL
jgi:hypothetical protein